MPVIVDKKGTLYKPFNFENESDFEVSVVDLADQIFGPSTIYVDIKKRVTGKSIISIPDGYVIDMTEPKNPKLFIVENEIVSHDAFSHVGIQLLKFVTSFEDAKVKVRKFIMAEIVKNKKHRNRLKEGCGKSKFRNIDAYLDEAIFGDFRGIVVIDEARSELHQVLQKINANISVLELRTFESDNGARLHQFDTLYGEYDDVVSTKPTRTSKQARTARRAKRVESDTIIVPAREDGFKKIFLGKDQWWAIRVGAAMKEKIEFIAAYQVAPVSAVTHIAKVQDIRPYGDTGKYIVIFKDRAKKIKPIKLKSAKYSPQGPVYVKRETLLQATYLEDAF